MGTSELHTFHIPVMGIAFTIDTPLKVAHLGITSVISIVDDELLEKMRWYHSLQSGEKFESISNEEDDFRAKRITAYLNLVHCLVEKRMERTRSLPFGRQNELDKYFDLLPEGSPLKKLYREMEQMEEGIVKKLVQDQLREGMQPGAIDVNIMSKLDKTNYSKTGDPLAKEFSDAMSALRGYANSNLKNSSVVFSAGYNPRLYAYVENFPDFYPDENGDLKKKIILKVSDYRSALTQGKIFAKKGLWVSEFRIESGLNCGGHVFATDGFLLGPTLEEFKKYRHELSGQLFTTCNNSLAIKGLRLFPTIPNLRFTVQGGIGTAEEHQFLLDYYKMDSNGWGSPFLLVPEATNVDDSTLNQLATAKMDDYFLSDASPLGVPFRNFRKSSSEIQRVRRVEKGRPGSPCYKKFLSSNTEFTDTPVCIASREYQNLKINQLKDKGLPEAAYLAELHDIVEKECLCEGLGAPVLLKDHIELSHHLTAVAICPGPNLAYFSGVFSLKQMVDHIYGRTNILNTTKRSNMFINELRLYVDYLKRECSKAGQNVTINQARYFKTFRDNLLQGIEYYKELILTTRFSTQLLFWQMKEELSTIEVAVKEFVVPAETPAVPVQ